VRIGVFSDIHGNVAALTAALAAMDGIVDEIWCAGDIVHEYRFSNETVALLRTHGVIAIQGNHDMVLSSAAGAEARARPGVDPAEVNWLASLPLRHEVVVDGRTVLMVHGSPWEPHSDYLRSGNRRWRDADQLDADILIVGHTHEPMVEQIGSTLVVNPGSLGEPRTRHERRGSYAVIDTVAVTAEIRFV
jgi:putative phosphoesterase